MIIISAAEYFNVIPIWLSVGTLVRFISTLHCCAHGPVQVANQSVITRRLERLGEVSLFHQ